MFLLIVSWEPQIWRKCIQKKIIRYPPVSGHMRLHLAGSCTAQIICSHHRGGVAAGWSSKHRNCKLFTTASTAAVNKIEKGSGWFGAPGSSSKSPTESNGRFEFQLKRHLNWCQLSSKSRTWIYELLYHIYLGFCLECYIRIWKSI